jgi:hypothetical protein
MNRLARYWQSGLTVLLLTCAFLFSACHSYHISVTVKNNTGSPISLLEVDYPTASFGADVLAAGADFHYVIQTRGSAPLKVLYTAPDGHQVQITGPTLHERQEGGIEVVLLPGGKADFHPDLHPAH